MQRATPQFLNYTHFLRYIENNYEEEDQLVIEGFIAYYINRHKGFGRRNCEPTYQENLRNDATGKLHELSLIGFDFEKKIYDERVRMGK